MPIGWLVPDIYRWASGAVDTLADSVGKSLRGVPGGGWIVEAAETGAGWVKDIASTGAGAVLFRALASSLYGPLALTLGPQVASVAFAVPGLAKGDDFSVAWITEFNERAQKTAEILGADVVNAALGPYIEKLKATIQPYFQEAMDQTGRTFAELGVSPEDIAGELGLNEYLGAKTWEALCGCSLGRLFPDGAELEPPVKRRSLVSRRSDLESAGEARYSAARLLSPAERRGVAVDDGISLSQKLGISPVRARPVTVAAPPSSQDLSTTRGVALVAVASLAAGALVWFYVGKRS